MTQEQMFKRLLIISILILVCILCFSHRSEGALLTGKHPQNIGTPPPGWTIITTQDFETGSCPPTQTCGSFDGALINSVGDPVQPPNYGNYYIKGTYANEQADVRWTMFNPTLIGSFSELYMSWYEYISDTALFNDEFFMAWAKKNVGPNDFQTWQLDWFWATENLSDPNTLAFNSPYAQLYLVPEWRNTGGAPQGTSGYLGRYFVKHAEIPKGRWVQWEVHIKQNTPGSLTTRACDPNPEIDPGPTCWESTGDGFIKVYLDGNYIGGAENINLTGNVDMSSMDELGIGGVYTKLTWMMDYPDCTICSERPGYGTDACHFANGWYTTPFQTWDHCTANSNPPGNDSPLPLFTRYFDDIIIMKSGTGTLPGTDVSAPYTTNANPSKGSQNISQSTTSVSFRLTDEAYGETGIPAPDGTYPAVTIQGNTLHCSDVDLTCTSGTDSYGKNYYDITYSNLTFNYLEEVIVTVLAIDVQGNILNDSWTYKVEPLGGVPLAFTAPTFPTGTLNEYVSFDVSPYVSGGTTPYSFSINSGALPDGLSLDANTGMINGTYTSVGVFTVDLKVTDSAGTPATDTTGNISWTVNDSVPSGQYTKTFGSNTGADYSGTITDTANVNQTGLTSVNYSTDTDFQPYTYPASTPVIIAHMKIDISSLPSNINISSAYLNMNVERIDGTGGDSPATLGLFNLTGTAPNISACTWDTRDGTNPWTGGADGGLADLSSTPFSTVSSPNSTGAVSFDVTDYIQGLYDGTITNKGFGIMFVNPSGELTNRAITSSEGTDGNRPELVVNYTVISGGTQSGGEGYMYGTIYGTWY